MAVRPTNTAMYALSIDGKHAGYLQAFEGGNPYAEVITAQAGPQGVQKKHIGNAGFEPISLKIGVSESAALIEWMQAAFNLSPVYKSGSVVALSQTGTVTEELQFSDALITEIAFPASDGAAKEAAYLTVKIKPETVRIKPGGGTKPPAPGKSQKPALASNFRFQLGKLPTKRVIKVEAFVVKQNVVRNEVGEHRDHGLQPAGVAFPNLRVVLAAPDALAWRKWADDFIVNGNAADDRELNGSLTWLGADLKTELATLTLEHVGIFRFAAEPLESGHNQTRRFAADLYCEQMRLSSKR